MAHRKPKGSHKKHKSKKHREKKNADNIYKIEEENAKKAGAEVYGETIMQDSLEANVSDIHTDESTAEASSDTGEETTPADSTNDANVNNDASDTNINKDSTNTSADFNNFCEDIKAKQQEISSKLKNLSEALADITLIRDDVNSLRVDTLTEVYFTRQVRPLLDTLNILSFSSTNMSATAIAFQANAFGDTKEIKNALKLTYKMNDEVDDVIHSLDRRLAIFLKLIDNMDKNCPPFDYGKDS